MGLLKSVNNVPGIDYYDYRDNDYYNKFVYRARFSIPGAHYTWYAKSVDQFLKQVNKSGSQKLRDSAKTNLSQLTEFVKFKLKVKELKTNMIRIEGNCVSVFSNDLQFLKDISNQITGITVDYTECVKNVYVGVKQFVKQPKHKYRVYLKSKRVGKEWADELLVFLKNTKGLYPSTALVFWANNKRTSIAWLYRWTSSSHFIDYDDESILSYLALLHGDYLGKRYKLEKRPD